MREAAIRRATAGDNASRIDARRFYERLGFEASHTGFKLALQPPR
ncbi:MAG: hypothetical protein ACTHJ6_02695 [Oryzihumus sp.]